MRKRCTKCGVESTDFGRDASNPDGLKSNCRSCVKHSRYATNMKKYGMTPETYDALLHEQEGRCAICRAHQSEMTRRFDIDHNHETGEVRGLLCYSCNRAIGLLKDDPEIVDSASAYLKTRGNYASNT